METSRQFRHSCLEGVKFVPENAGDEVKSRTAFEIPSGVYRHATVNPDGSILFSSKAFSDDIVAFVYWMVRNNATMSPELKWCLRDYVIGMDERAVRRHGYAANDAERNFEWTIGRNLSEPVCGGTKNDVQVKDVKI